jgi:hypothetical protein
MMAQATMPVVYAADPDDPRLPYQIIEEINAVKAQYRADVQASKATTADLYQQKKALVAEYKSVRQETVDRVRQINQAMRAARSNFSTTRSAINAEMRIVRTAQMQLRRSYSIARRTMNAEDFAVFNASYSEQMAAITDQYMVLRGQLSAASTNYRNLVNSLRGQLNDERQIQRALWTDLKTVCTPIDEERKAERAASNQLRADYNATIQALNDELNAAREKERDIRENGGSWTPDDSDPNEE